MGIMKDLPVLILGYNRLDKFTKCIKTVQKQGIKKVYVSIDGPKNVYDHEVQKKIIEICSDNNLGIDIKIKNLKKNYGCRIAPIKGIDLFIEALKDIDFNGWRCSLYGPGEEDYIYEIKCLIKNKNLSDKVSLHKGVFGEEKYKLLQNASAFILPSYSEAFGIAIAEAMAFELPIVTTKTTPWNIIEKEKLGWYVNPSKNDLSKAIQELFYSKKEDLEEMGSKAKKIINKNFDWNETSEKIMKEIKILYNKN